MLVLAKTKCLPPATFPSLTQHRLYLIDEVVYIYFSTRENQVVTVTINQGSTLLHEKCSSTTLSVFWMHIKSSPMFVFAII
jgi:hypothetical protein